MAAGVVLCAVVALASPSLGWAEDSKKASALNAKAIDSYKAKNFLEAIDFWLQAAEVASKAQLIKLHKNLGLALYKLERLPEAWYHLTHYMQRIDKTDAKVARKIVELEKRLKKVHARVNISSQPAGALGVLPPGDRMHRIVTPFEWWLPPGEYVIVLEKEGYLRGEEKVRVELDADNRFSFPLREVPKTGTVKLTGKTEGSNVRVDGKSVGPLPYAGNLLPGSHKLEVIYPDGQVWKGTADVKAGKTLEMVAHVGTLVGPIGGTKVAPKESRVWQWITISAGAVLLATGGITTAMSVDGLGRYDEVNEKYNYITSTSHPDYKDKYLPEYNSVWTDDIEPYMNMSYVFYGVGGAAVAVGVVGLFFPTVSGVASEESSVTFAPLLAPGQAGASFGLKF
jgi:hypothetical protein